MRKLFPVKPATNQFQPTTTHHPSCPAFCCAFWNYLEHRLSPGISLGKALIYMSIVIVGNIIILSISSKVCSLLNE